MVSSPRAIKTAIIGYGLSATVFHIPFIQSSAEFELVAISSSQKDAILRSFPEIKVYSSAESMVENTEAELIIIAAPNDVHFSLMHLALSYCKHVIIEKPFVIAMEQGERILELAHIQKKVLAVFHNRRWDGDFLTVKYLIKSGRMGKVRYFESHFDRFRPEVQQRWREQTGEGTGVLYDLGPHLIDQVLDIFGMPEAVTARCLALRAKAETTDFFNLWLHYSDKEVVLQSSPFAAAPIRRFHVQGTQASYVKCGLDPQEALLRQGVVPEGPDWCAENPDSYGVLYAAEKQVVVPTLAGGYQHFFANVADAILSKRDLVVSPQDALNSIKIIELAVQSSKSGKTITVA